MRILLADNDYNFGYVLKKELEEHCHTVDIVTTGIDAIINFIEKEYEYVLLEVSMPRIRGDDTCKIINKLRELKEINKKSKIITFSCENKKKGDDTKTNGSWKYLKKPFNIEALVLFMEEGK
jgi:DNA-binding response OmpR family regulator